ncbi:UNVERIFIED_CONTAM: hypothetical protein Scaly_0066200 [Sesamum calycinum]|uniref:Transposase MuDR plant domain-containing protein n=1 Tax=Sesamum calycinum TaxID=2727403 RepID=A0AAW2SUT2_9LAMI
MRKIIGCLRVMMRGLSRDELPNDKESDGEWKKYTFPIFNSLYLFEPTFALGMIFINKKELRYVIQLHAIKSKANIKIAKNDRERFHAKCAGNDCMWRIHACALKTECTFQIKDYVPNHTCNITFHVKNMKSTWLSKKYMHKFKTDPKRWIKGFIVDVIEEIRCNTTRNQVARAKRFALLMLEGSASEQYALLWDNDDETKRSNPRSTVILGTEQEDWQNIFDRFYVCLQALKLNYLNGYRLVICVDGCHLKGAYGGVLLSYVSIDPNNNLFPICYAVVMKENKDTSDWFLTLLKMNLRVDECGLMPFMSDKQKRNIEKLGGCIPIKSDDKHYQVSCFDGTQYSVDLENATCGCRKWDLSGIPCKCY